MTAGTTYTVNYYEAIRQDGFGQPDALRADVTFNAGSASGVTSQLASNPLTNNSNFSGWLPFTFAFTPDTSTTATLRFSLNNGLGYPVLDNVSVNAIVPEPASLVLVGLGSLGLLAVARRSRQGRC